MNQSEGRQLAGSPGCVGRLAWVVSHGGGDVPVLVLPASLLPSSSLQL